MKPKIRLIPVSLTTKLPKKLKVTNLSPIISFPQAYEVGLSTLIAQCTQLNVEVLIEQIKH